MDIKRIEILVIAIFFLLFANLAVMMEHYFIANFSLVVGIIDLIWWSSRIHRDKE